MSDTTTTTPDTSYSGLTIADWSTTYRTPQFGTFDRWQSYLMTNNEVAAYVWDEAHEENARRDQEATTVPAPPVEVGHELRARIAELEAELTTVRDALRDERTRQIDGSDSRLREFWQRAADLADEAGHCQVYDELAEALGGEPRRQDYSVTVTYRFSLSLTKAEVDDFDLSEYDPAEHDYDPDIYIERD